MSKIQSQSILHFFISGLTLLVGAVNNLSIFSSDLELKGLFDFLITAATILTLFAGTSVSALPLKYFPIFETKDGKNNGLLLLCILSGFLLSAIMVILLHVLLIFNYSIHSKFLENIGHYKWTVSMLIILVGQVHILVKYLHNFQKVSFTTFVTSLIFKLLTGLAFYLIIKDYLDKETGIYFLPAIFMIQIIILLFYLYKINHQNFSKINFEFLKPNLKSEIWKYGMTGVFMTMSYTIIDKITLSMLAVLADFKQNGIFGINSYMATILLIPYISVVALYAPIISKGMATNDYAKVLEKYRKSSDFLLAFGILLFLLIWANLDLLPYLSKNIAQVIAYKYVILFISLGYFSNMVFSVNDHIIAYSKHYRFNIFAAIILIVSDVSLNYLLIPNYGVYGAGIAACISLILFNVSKSYFIYLTWKMNVLRSSSFYIFILGTLTFLILNQIQPNNIIQGFALKNISIILLFILPVIYFGFSEIIEDLKIKYLLGK